MSIQPSKYRGGENVKVSSLSIGAYIRDPRNRDRIMIVEEIFSDRVFVRGLDKADTGKHRYIPKDFFVDTVTDAETETSILPEVTLPTPTAWWRFDENANNYIVADDEGVANGNSLNTTASMSVPGVLNTAFNFNAVSDYVLIANNATIDIVNKTAFTYEFWMNPDSQGGYGRGSIVSVMGVNGDGFDLYTTGQGDTGVAIGSEVTLQVPPGGGAAYYKVSPSIIPIGSWSHIVFVWRNDDEVLYVNGLPLDMAWQYGRDPAGITYPLYNRNFSLQFGLYYRQPGPPPGTSEYYDGKLDNIRFWNGVALDKRQAQKLYNNGLGLIY